MDKTKLVNAGVDEQLVDELTRRFQSKLKGMFEEENIPHEQKDIDYVTEIFIEYWTDICTKQEEYNLERLKRELNSDENHANVAFTLGISLVRGDPPNAVRELISARMDRKYR